jgi:pectinesterase
MFSKVLTLLLLAVPAICAATPPGDAITVGPDGIYSTLTTALADTSSNVFFVYATSIKERVEITRANITIYGQTSNALTYSSNLVTITNNLTAATAGGNEQSATISVKAANVKLYNLNIANTAGQSVSLCLKVRKNEYSHSGIGWASYRSECCRSTVWRLRIETYRISRHILRQIR